VEEFLTVEQLAQRLGWSEKTVRNKMCAGGIFKKGVHFAEAPGLPVLFKWSAVLAMYDWSAAAPTPLEDKDRIIPMVNGYMK